MNNASSNKRISLYGRVDPDAVLASAYGPAFTAYRKAFKLAERGVRPDFPPHLDVDVTTNCQLTCPMCPCGQKDPTFPGLGLDLDPKIYQLALKEGANKSLYSIRLGLTGEPLLIPDLSLWVKEAVSLGVLDVTLITNGLMLTPEVSLSLIKAGLTRLMISVDAVTETTYAAMRPGGSFLTLMENITAFLALRKELNISTPLLRLSFVATSLNYKEKEAFIDAFWSLADYLSVQRYHNITQRLDLALADPPSAGKMASCLDPLARLALHANGGLFPCCSDFGRLNPLGYFPEKTIKEVWNSPVALSLAAGSDRPSSCDLCAKAAGGLPTVGLNHHQPLMAGETPIPAGSFGPTP
ncbi:MAG: radical SAM protein [Deltaproteobacteria bacterium]|jgi:MoaA/NifB/PqqE/SkfB family radical SAM enzyme|nr:radical SAM protein [Deltaproteobacteria bacterium]